MRLEDWVGSFAPVVRVLFGCAAVAVLVRVLWWVLRV